MRFALAACGVAVVALVLLALAGPAYRVNALSLQNAFALLRWGAYIGVAAMLAAAVVGALSWRRRAWPPVAIAALAFVLGAVAFGVPYRWQHRARSVPPIHDITTDLQNPPAFGAIVPLRADAPNSLDYSPEVAEQQRQAYPDIRPVTLQTTPGETFDRALQVAQDMGWDIVTADRSDGRIEATDTTRWFGFTDDIVVRLTPWGSGTRVDVRSVSRIGRSDAGTNARRIRHYLDQLERG